MVSRTIDVYLHNLSMFFIFSTYRSITCVFISDHLLKGRLIFHATHKFIDTQYHVRTCLLDLAIKPDCRRGWNLILF